MNLKYNSSSTLLVVCLLSVTSSSANAFTAFSSHSSLSTDSARGPALFSTTSSRRGSKNTEDAFSAFAESLDEDDLFNDNNNNNVFNGDSDAYAQKTWQESLENLLDPTTPPAKRQILLTDLLSSNEDIREDILAALRERKIDNLLTPTGKKLQNGTRAVARQITSDILPTLSALASNSASNGSSRTASSLLSNEIPSLIPKIGSSIFDAVQNQAKKTFATISEDLANPANIPQRISKQTATIATEAKNVFLETPEGLVGPKYTVVASGEGYEIRDYEAYKVASTTMSKVGETYSLDDITKSGTAFNTLAAYLFGANDEGRIMEMTTPVSTTSVGEMRFYLKTDGSIPTDFPEPLAPVKDFNEKGAVKIIDVPASRLAVVQFTGFVTEGEVSRQKDALLSSLAIDGVEVDTPHGVKIPHVVFQYNPPYTIPIVRRNEIAVPVRSEEDFVVESNVNLESRWKDDGKADDSKVSVDESEVDDSPSDVE